MLGVPDRAMQDMSTSAATTGYVVNGERVQARAATLGDLIAELGYGGAKVATAVNGAFVPQRTRFETRLAAADRIEIVAPRQGG